MPWSRNWLLCLRPRRRPLQGGRLHQAGEATYPHPLVLLLDRGRVGRTRVDVVLVASALPIAIQEDGGLVDTIDDAIFRNLATGNAGERREQIHCVHDLVAGSSGRDFARPANYERYSHRFFEVNVLGRMTVAAKAVAVIGSENDNRVIINHTTNAAIYNEQGLIPRSHSHLEHLSPE